MVHSEWDEKRKGRWELGQVQGDCQSLVEFSEPCAAQCGHKVRQLGLLDEEQVVAFDDTLRFHSIVLIQRHFGRQPVGVAVNRGDYDFGKLRRAQSRSADDDASPPQVGSLGSGGGASR
jgi:hypothetical protein